jgi:SAM-dependent methyltransferase
VISNCVINLSTDKDAVLRETFRVLKAGGRFAVSDVIVRGAVSDEVRRSVEAWIGCIAGALGEQEYAAKLRAAGFTDVDVEVWRTYDHVEAPGTFASAFIRATKPANAACCGPACCSSGAL